MYVKRTFLPGDQWLYLKLYSGPVFSNQLLGEILFPILKNLEKSHQITTWFFIRYNDPQDHIRLRFQTNNYARLLNTLNQTLKPYTEQGILWNMEIATYNREIERYHPENIAICEELFSNESKLICTILNQKIDSESYLILALSLMSFYIDLLIDEPEERISFLSGNYLSYKGEFGVNKVKLKELNRKHRQLAKPFEQFDLFKYVKNKPVFAGFLKNQSSLVYRLSNKEKIADSLIHMFVNRLFHSNPRALELIMYHHLEKNYKSKKARTHLEKSQ